MHILYIHQYFCTPKDPGGTRSYWIAQELLKNGHKVSMLTSSTSIEEKKQVKTIDGIEVIYLNVKYHQSMSIFQRLIAFIKFMLKSIKTAKRIKEIDLVFATSTPLTVGITALYLNRFKKKPYVFEVRDLWPEVPIQMGAIKNLILIKLLRWLEKKIYQNANHIIALSPGMLEGVLKYVPAIKASMIPNMSKIDKFWPREKNSTLLKHLELSENTFKVIHFGALGLANGAETILSSATLLKSNSTVEFIFVGGGSQEENLKQICKEQQLNNVRFLGKMPMEILSEIVNLCEVSIVSFKDLPILYTNSPNKLFDSLSAGKPIIVNSAGWTKEMVEENQCGYYVNPNHPEELVNKILYLQSHPEILAQMSENSRKLAEKTYDKSILCKQVVAVLEATSNKR